jgi:hypothetical protein
MITTQDFIQFIDSNTFISHQCLAVLSTLDNEEGLYISLRERIFFLISLLIVHSKPISLIVHISSSNREHRFSYAIGTISLTTDISWLELERMCIKIFIDHMTQIDSPFDYVKSSIGCTANNIDTLTLGKFKRR